MSKPVRVFIDGQELVGYTNLSLQRSKEQLTGSLSIGIFMGWLPNEPVYPVATKGREVSVYVGGYLAFNGVIDRRSDSGQRMQDADASRTLTIGANEYSVKLTARGKTKYLIDSSHQHKTGTMLRVSNRDVIEELLSPWNLDIAWEADVIDLDRVRFRDGGFVVDELRRLATQCSLYLHEDVQGRLKVSDGPGTQVGEPISLGVNILSFTTDQSEVTERSQITVKGQLTKVGEWGTPAVIPTLLEAVDSAVKSFIPISVQVFGNATPELLDRRAQYEANKRTAQSKRITVEVFHVQQTDGKPWDIGGLHHVIIPPAGVDAMMEITEVTYNVGINELTTTIVLTPPPVKAKTSQPKPALMSAVKQRTGSLSVKADADGNVGQFGEAQLEATVKTKVVDYVAAEPVLSAVEKVKSPPLYIGNQQ